MRSKLIRVRGPVIAPLVFMLLMVGVCLLLALSTRYVDRIRKGNGNVSLCAFCHQPLPLQLR